MLTQGNATHAGTFGMTRYEKEMECQSTSTGGLASLLAGASRAVRLNQPVGSPHEETLRDIAAGVAGPVLWSFVTWIIRTAQREGLRRIWFTARDGQVMLRMARRIAPMLGADLQLGYLFGGRQVVHLAGLRRIDAPALNWLTGGAGVITCDALLERVGLAAADLIEPLERYGIPLTGVLGWGRMAVLQRFFADAAVAEKVLAVAGARREDMRSYFRSCGLIAGQPSAIVDIGWRGSVLRSMFDIMGQAEAARHHFLYFGLYKRPVDVPEANMSAYCFDLSGPTVLGSAHDVPALTSVMEIFCQADHGQIVRVERRDAAHVPVLRPPPATLPTLWSVPFFQSCLEMFAESVRFDTAVDADADLRRLCESLLRCLMATPEAAEASVLGSVQYVDDQSGSTSQPFAHAYQISDWRELARSGKLPLKTLAWWEEGAWALTPGAVRLLLRSARVIATLRRRAVPVPALPGLSKP